jgi:phosphoribosyl 1,2-cyclic phosphodiesterase/ActR/RegA family two-component response regulator
MTCYLQRIYRFSPSDMKTVFIVDDEVIFRTTLARMLTERGWRVVEAGDGETALSMLLEQQPDVVLCDLLMPGMNGFQVIRFIQEHRSSLRNTRIIVTTSSGYAVDRTDALKAGADEYLIKPIISAELFRILDRFQANDSNQADALKTSESAAPQKTRFKFWGVRGSLPTPGPSTVHYGGNTSCVELRADGEIIILDAGTGVRGLGMQLTSEFKNQPLHLTLLLTHTHWDHIQGFPFFAPAYRPGSIVRVLAFEGARKGLEATLSSQMESPYFPINMEQMPGNVLVQELKSLSFKIGKVRVEATFLNHPGVCAGYRLFTSSGSIAYLPDNELYQRQRAGASQHAREAEKFAQHQDYKLIEFLKGADALIIDSQYDAEEYAQHVGWGHSCADDSIALAAAANVKTIFLFHHDPSHDDAKISEMLARGREIAKSLGSNIQVLAAREGEGFELPLSPPTNC